jgi:hypothetical protein
MYQTIHELPRIAYKDACKIGAITTQENRRYRLTKEDLARKWNIRILQAKQTLKVATQHGLNNAMHTLHRRFCAKQSQLHYMLLGTRHGRFYSDTMFSNVKYTQGNTCGQDLLTISLSLSLLACKLNRKLVMHCWNLYRILNFLALYILMMRKLKP